MQIAPNFKIVNSVNAPWKTYASAKASCPVKEGGSFRYSDLDLTNGATINALNF